MKTISMRDLQNNMQAEMLTLIDVRAAERYNQGHISGAINIPFDQLENHLDYFEKDKSYYLVCQLGIKSQEATDLLTQKGYEAINVEGGMAVFEGDLEIF